MTLEYAILKSKLEKAEKELAEVRKELERANSTPMIYKEGKAYVSLNTNGAPSILFGIESMLVHNPGTFAFYTNCEFSPADHVFIGIDSSAQNAITHMEHLGRTVYEFDTMKEAMEFFLEHWKE